MEIKIERVLAARVAVSNADEAAREFAVEAEVQMEGEQVQSAQGAVRDADATAEEGPLATFSTWSAAQLSLGFERPCDRSKVMAAVEDFLVAVRSGLVEAVGHAD